MWVKTGECGFDILEEYIYLLPVMKLRRNISAILLSAVMLPALLLAPMHRHQPVEEAASAYSATGSYGTGNAESNTDVSPDADSNIDNCVGCESHIPHSHLEGVPHTYECLVCQFLTIVWLASDEESPEAPVEECSDVVIAPEAQFALPSVQVPGMRAPPFVFC